MTKPSRSRSKGRRSPFRLIIAGGKGAHGIEPGNAQSSDGGFDASAIMTSAMPSRIMWICLADGVGTCGAGGLHGQVRSLQSVINRDQPWSHIADDHRNEEGADFFRPGFEERLVVFFDRGYAPSRSP